MFGAILVAAGVVAAQEDEAEVTPPRPPTAAELDFFEKKIRPVLVQNCYKCHSANAEKIRGGLLLDTREGIRRGGDNGPAIVPGDTDESVLIQAIRYTNPDFAMPPKSASGKLPDAVIADFEKWIAMGAPDPRDGASKVVKKWDYDDAKKWWSFQPPQTTKPPTPKDKSWAKTDLDKFLLYAMEAKGVKPVADADKLTLLRRVYFDLIGLPPTPQAIDAFWKDNSPDALAKVVDQLLASPQFGERWGRHWLDVARYAESTGKEINIAYPQAWRYRDYVIESFNEDKPYDQFIREQIAGDQLPTQSDSDRAEQIIATGFLAIGAKSLNERDPRQFYMDIADEQIDTMSQAILGVTIACARCHDHKFDPIPQREYYAMAGIFTSTDTRYGTFSFQQNRHATDLIELPVNSGEPVLTKSISPAELAKKESLLAELKEKRDAIVRDAMEDRLGKKPDSKADKKNDKKKGDKVDRQDVQKPAPMQPAQSDNDRQRRQRELQVLLGQIGKLDAEIKLYNDNGKPRGLAMGVKDLPVSQPQRGFAKFKQRYPGDGKAPRPPGFDSIGDSALYARGEISKPQEKIPRGFVSIIGPVAPSIPSNESGRRQLADWLSSPQNPLTARVMANRIWYWLFGRGIVSTVDNFGNSGQKPDNEALLDYLSIRFQQNGWSVKKTIREIVLSRAYRLSSAYDGKNFSTDPDNTLVWRANKRRLDAECIHDAMLYVAGNLNLTPPVGDVIALAGDGPIAGKRGMGLTEAAVTADTSTRSVYQAIARDMVPDSLDAFDFPDPSMVLGSREATNVPSQALYMLNSSFATKQASSLAEKLIRQFPAPNNNPALMANFDQRVAMAYWLVFTRPPTPAEKNAASNFFMRFPANWKKGEQPLPSAHDSSDVKAAWTSFCRALFASAEFRYIN